MTAVDGEIYIAREWSSTLFSWKVNNFDKKFDKLNKSGIKGIKSPYFNFLVGDEIVKKLKWQIILHRNDDDVHLVLCVPKYIEENQIYLPQGVKTKFIIGFGSIKNLWVVSKQAEHNFDEEKNILTLIRFVKISDLYNKKELLEDNILRLNLQLKIENDLVQVSSTNYFKDKQLSISNKFFQDFAGLRHKQKHSDVEIKCGNATFYCHKAILAARSPVFDTMFDVEVDKVDIYDLEPNTVSGLLHYIYTGKVDVLPGPCSWTDLIHGAYKYDLVDLKNYCFDKLFQDLSEVNAGALALVAENYKADVKIQQVVKEFCKFNLKSLMEEPSFKKLYEKHPNAFLQD